MEVLLLILGIYLVCHIPAIVMLILGLRWLKTKPEVARFLLIGSTVYFVIGAGICGSILT